MGHSVETVYTTAQRCSGFLGCQSTIRCPDPTSRVGSGHENSSYQSHTLKKEKGLVLHNHVSESCETNMWQSQVEIEYSVSTKSHLALLCMHWTIVCIVLDCQHHCICARRVMDHETPPISANFKLGRGLKVN